MLFTIKFKEYKIVLLGVFGRINSTHSLCCRLFNDKCICTVLKLHFPPFNFIVDE